MDAARASSSQALDYLMDDSEADIHFENGPNSQSTPISFESDLMNEQEVNEGSISVPLSESKQTWSIPELLSKLRTGDFKEVKKSNARSAAWEKFNIIVDEKSKPVGYARCISCKSIILATAKVGTNNLLKRNCSKASASSFTAAVRGSHRITDFVVNHQIPSSAKSDYTKAVTYLCAKDLRPFEIINGVGFRNMVATLLQIGSKFGKLDIDQLTPNPKTISRNTASMARDLMKKQVEKVIPIFGKFGGAITVDFWTDDYQKNSFLTITGHYIDNSWNLQNILIGLHHWEPGKPQTGENIRRFLYEKLREFGLEEDLVARNLIFVTDEGGNLRVALNRQCRLNCSAHVLNTALKNSFKNAIEPVTSVLDSCNALVSFIRKSHMKAQLSKTVKPAHSKIDMIESILDVFDELEMILSERDELHRLDGIEKATLATLLQLLKPFRVAILQMETSSGYPTLPLVIPVYQMLTVTELRNRLCPETICNLLFIRHFDENA